MTAKLKNKNSIQTILVEVSNSIKQKHQKNFAKNSLLLNDVKYSENSKIYLNYIEEISSYQIIVDNKNSYLDSEVFILKYKNKNSKKIDLYITDNLFVLYKYGKFYYCHRLENSLNQDDLVEYIQLKLKLKVDSSYFVNEFELEKLKNEFEKKYKKSTLLNINSKKSYVFKLYTLYLILLFGFSYVFFQNNILSKNNQIVEKRTIKISELESPIYKPFSKKLFLITNDLDRYNLKLLDILYDKDILKLNFIAKRKKEVYLFLSNYKTKILNSSIIFLEKEKLYRCSLDVKSY